MAKGGYEPHIAVRIVPHQGGSGCDVQFDFPYSDGRDWIGRSKDMTVLIDKEESLTIENAVVDFQDGEFQLAFWGSMKQKQSDL